MSQLYLVLVLVALLMLTQMGVEACTDSGRDCQYSNECCSGRCSAVFKYCLS